MKKLLIAFRLCLLFLLILALSGCLEQGTALEAEPEQTAGATAPTETSEAADRQEEMALGEVASEGGAVLEAIRNSYTARDYVDGTVDAADIEKILQAGSKAPSAMNAQPWHFSVVSNSEVLSAILQEPPKGAVAIVVSGGNPDGHPGINVDLDCGLATENMYLAAQALGLGAHIYTGPVGVINSTLREELSIPTGYDAVTVLLVGCEEKAVDAVASASVRNPMEDLVTYID